MRLFVALWPAPEVIELIRAIERPAIAGLRWSTEEQWHVTLRFLGNVSDPAEVFEKLSTLAGQGVVEQPLTATLGPASVWFPGRRVLQVPVEGLDDLAAAVNEATEHWPAKEQRRFKGHLTLARVRARGASHEALDCLEGIALRARWGVDSLALVASHLGREGARYETLGTIALGNSALG